MSSTVILPPADVARDVEHLAPPRRRSRLHALWRGREEDAAWVRPTLLSLLAVTAVLYLWGLGASGWANSYYAAAVQAGTKSWKAFLFGSSDASNFITVDKTPASLWPMEISARIFGLSSWSMLVPQALEGVAMVGVLYATIRRWFSPAAALTAGAVAALTPVAALMFRFNNPDALLVLLLTIGAYAMTRALEDGRTRWLLLAGGLVGFAFLTKELQAFLVLPAFGLAYVICGPPQLGRRIAQLVALGGAVLVSAGWWVALVELWPASDRPYIGGSQNNSFFNVLFGYNGFGRLTGNESGSVGGAAQGAGRWGPTGWTRLFNDAFGGQASWLLPAALIFTVAGLAYTWKRPRTDRTRAALILWGASLFVTGAVFSLSKGIIHEYYTVALAPLIGALVGIGVGVFWPRRSHPGSRAVLAVAVAVTALWANALLERTPDWNPWLRTLVLVGGGAVALTIAFGPALTGRAAAAVGIGALVVGLAAPAAYTLSTVATPKSGAIPLAGPASARAFGRFGPGGGPGGRPGGGFGGAPGGPGGGVAQGAGVAQGGPPNGGGFGGGRGGGAGGLLNGSEPGAALTKLLEQGSRGYRWVAAAVGANSAAGYQLASGEPIMAIGGFNGTDPTPTLAQFEAYVRNGDIHYFIASGGGFGGPGGGGGSSTSSEIRSWVESNFTARTVDGVTIYDLTSRTV
ncbi:MAG TPA: glycosyltransferase family 39 protein [Acidimicrobiia bacterium]|nr:glycosyltransferase family 39 protein [Acidimicrobiia bacterium]